MSDNITNFPVKFDAALSSYLAIQGLECISNCNSSRSPLVYTKENGRIKVLLSFSTAARICCAGACSPEGQRFALQQATAVLPVFLSRTDLYLDIYVGADGLTIRDSQHAQEATYECKAAIDVATARDDGEAARRWSDIETTLTLRVVDPLEVAISLVYDA